MKFEWVYLLREKIDYHYLQAPNRKAQPKLFSIEINNFWNFIVRYFFFDKVTVITR